MIWRREDAEAHREPEDRHDERREAAKDERMGGGRMADSGEVTVIGQAAKLEGTVVSAGSLRIDGQVKGQINADGDCSLSPQSQVEADIRAQNVSVAGRFKGNILVKGRAEIARGGRVDGNITSKSLVIEEGAIFQGQSVMDQEAAHAAQAAQAAPAQQQPGRAPEAPNTGERAKV
jgi:cytoskeletal protein CcmA (bactofilin family)